MASTAARLPAGQHAMMDRPVRSTLSSGSSHSSSMNSSGNRMPRSRVTRYRKPVCSSARMSLSASSTPTIMSASGVVQPPTALQNCCTGAGSRQPVASSTSIATVAMLVGVMKVLSRIFSPGRNRHTT